MGAWGLSVFDNDAAMDSTYELLESSGTSAINRALEFVLAADDYLEVDEGSAGLAAIEIINCLKGHPPKGIPNDVKVWLSNNSNTEVSHLVSSARDALSKINDEELSEVAQLWLEEGHDWKGMIANITGRLSA